MLKAWRTWAFIVGGSGVVDIMEVVDLRTSWEGRVLRSCVGSVEAWEAKSLEPSHSLRCFINENVPSPAYLRRKDTL